MRRSALRIGFATALVALGWTAGRAAPPAQADFELQVQYPDGQTTITCLRGCGLQFIRMTPSKAEAKPSFTYSCSNSRGTCGGTVQGWLLP
jgi:hypothetical protein